MNYFPSPARLPRNPALLATISQAAGRLHEKLAALTPADLPISEYNQRYLSQYQRSLPATLTRYATILALALEGVEGALEDQALLDYGGGLGGLALLAREMGIGQVLYNDIYDVSCRDAAVLGEEIGRAADAYLPGDIEEVGAAMAARGRMPEVLVSNDVLEHIYDVAAFYQTGARLGIRRVVMATGANTRNPLIRRATMAHHRRVEFEDRPAEWGQKERDARRAYLSIRQDIIRQQAPDLDEAAVEALAHATRGHDETAIVQATAAYQASGEIAIEPAWLTNTCDPLTGNWAEHLLPLGWLRDVVRKAGYRVQIRGGYYAGSSGQPVKKLAGQALNFGVMVGSGVGLLVAPYMVVLARR